MRYKPQNAREICEMLDGIGKVDPKVMEMGIEQGYEPKMDVKTIIKIYQTTEAPWRTGTKQKHPLISCT